jgi:hypothetical protein
MVRMIHINGDIVWRRLDIVRFVLVILNELTAVSRSLIFAAQNDTAQIGKYQVDKLFPVSLRA